MGCTCVDSSIEQLSRLLKRASLSLPMKQEILTLLLDLRFLKMFLICLANCKAAEEDSTLHHLRSSPMMNAEGMLEGTGEKLYDAGYFASIGIDVKDWSLVASDLQERVVHLKPEIRKTCILLVDCSFEPEIFSSDCIMEFMDSILKNLKDLVSSRDGIVVPVKVQIEALQEKLRFSRNLLGFMGERCGIEDQDKLEAFSTVLGGWAKNTACLSLLYWMDGGDGNMAPQTNAVLHDMLQKVMPCTPKVIDMYLELLKACKSSKTDKHVMGEIVVSFLDILKEHVVVDMKNQIEVLQEGLVLLITFIMDPPKELEIKSRIVVFPEIYAVIREVIFFICSLRGDKMDEDTCSERRTLLPGLLERIKEVEAEVRELNDEKPSSWHFNFPMTDGIGFIDFLLGNLNKMLKHRANFAKLKIATIHQELLRLRPFLEDIMPLQNDSAEPKDLWTRIINAAYLAEYVVNSCSTSDTRIWSNKICLSNVIDEIKHVQAEVVNIKQNQIFSKRNPSLEKSYSVLHRASVSSTVEVVGLANDVKAVVNKLTRGSMKLSIVSIAGTPEVGKTTLAMKVYDDPSVQCYFVKRAWCYVSQVYRRRDMLLDILRCIIGIDHVEISKKNDYEIADLLRKSLKRQNFLIVMDDMWNIGAWDAVKHSLPDDVNGSRILFTSRNHNLAEMSNLDPILIP